MKCAISLLAALIVSGVAGGAAQQPVNARAEVLKDFVQRVDQYAAMHRKLDRTLPKLPTQTTPAEADAHERALGKLIQQARSNAKPGDIFTPAMQQLVRTLLVPIFQGPGGNQIKYEITDNEYKGDAPIAVNARYPDVVPLSTMPPQVLAALPKPPEELEYRFVRTTLILLDPGAHIIADYMEHAFK
ncbi:MAG TPA: hypothetical protein VGL62_13685 [Vicinamibacterales bacterium]|jgi:hypothetical protein